MTQNLLTALNVLVTLMVVLGAFMAYHHGFARTVSDVQTRVISAMQHEIDTFHSRLATLEKENTRLSQVISTIRAALKQRGLRITIEGELVSIHDRTGNVTQTTRIVDTPPTAASDSGAASESEED